MSQNKANRKGRYTDPNRNDANSYIQCPGNPLLYQHVEAIARLHAAMCNAGFKIFQMLGMKFDHTTGKFSCECGNPECKMPGKHPATEWTKDAKRYGINELWERVSKHPYRGWGVHLGHSKLVCIDIDSKGGGTVLLAKLIELIGPLPVTPQVLSGSGNGSLHIYLRAKDFIDAITGAGRTTFHPFADGGPFEEIGRELAAQGVNPRSLEIFSGQHVAILPGSPHKSGGMYEFAQGLSVTDVPIAEMPPAFEAMLRERTEKIRAAAERTAEAIRRQVALSEINVGADADATVRRAAAYIREKEGAVSGEWGSSHTCNVAAVLVRDFALSIADAFPIIAQWNATCSPPWSDADLIARLEWALEHGSGEFGSKLNSKSFQRRDMSDTAKENELLSVLTNITFGSSTSTKPSLPIGGDGAKSLGITPALPLDDFESTLHPSLTAPELDLVALAAAGYSDPPRVQTVEELQAQLKPVCMCQSRVLMKHLYRYHFYAVFYFDCRRLACESCGPKKVDQWVATIRHHWNAYAIAHPDSTTPVYVYHCPAELWRAQQKRIRDHKSRGSRFMRLDTNPTDDDSPTYLVASTIPPSSRSGIHYSEVTPQAAADALVAHLRRPFKLERKAYFASVGWGLVGDEPSHTSNWKRVGKSACSPERLEYILDRYNLDPKTFTVRGAFWTRYMVTFHLGGLDAPPEHIVGEIQSGELLPQLLACNFRPRPDNDPSDTDSELCGVSGEAETPFNVDLSGL